MNGILKQDIQIKSQELIKQKEELISINNKKENEIYSLKVYYY